MSCLPIISQITQVIQRQGASLLSRHLDIHSDLRLQITLKRSTPAHREGNRVDKHLSEVERQMPEEGRKPRADTRAAPASGSDSSMSEERRLQAGRTAQELGTGRTLGMPRAGAALRDVRNAEDRTCPAFSRGKKQPHGSPASLFNTDMRACAGHPLGETVIIVRTRLMTPARSSLCAGSRLILLLWSYILLPW